MTQRPRKPFRSAATPPHRFAVHPLSLAVLLTVAGPAYSLPQGGLVVGGQATIQNPAANLQVVTQGSQKAIIDWRSFSIGAGERVRFDQPNSTAVLLNRVTGYEPTAILGQMQANGRIFLLNPYGVVFGANARIDVGGMVASTLALSNNDFLASRYSLGTPSGVTLGEVRNEGTINAPGGTVVLAGPTVVNTGSIGADGGRVGLAAAERVLVDVEGDGLIFFEASATQASNRLRQLGRIQADGGSVELRAAARGSFADTVLNMDGVVQARSLGTRQGRVVIDGGDEGISRVAGSVDASSTSGRGGDIGVTGQRVLVDGGATLDASGAAGGGRVRVGGGFQGRASDIRNAQATIVAGGATLKADATGTGHGGEVVVWADSTTRHLGAISARGGATGGNGGSVEVSGAKVLDFRGQVDTSAPAGAAGSLLLDPDSIEVRTGGVDNPPTNTVGFDDAPTSTAIDPANLDAKTGLVTLQAKNTIVFTDPVNLTSSGSALTAQAGGNITVNATIQTRVGITLSANDPGGTQAAGRVAVNADLTATGTNAAIVVNNNGSASANTLAANVAAANTGSSVSFQGTTAASGTRAVSAGAGGVSFGAITGSAALTVTTPGAAAFGGPVAAASLTTNGAGTTTLAGNVTTTGAQSYNATAFGAAVTLSGSSVTLASLNAAGNAFGVNADALAITGATSNLAAVSVAPSADGVSMGLAGGAGTLALGQTLIDKLNGTSLTLGRSGSSAAITAGATLALPADTTINNGTGAVTLGTVTGGANGLTLTTSGGVSLGTVTAASLSANGAGTTTLNGNVTTTGAQSYGPVILAVDTVLAGTNITLGGAVTGANDLTLTASGTAAVNGSVTTDTLTSNGSGGTTLGATVTTTGAQSYNATTLGAPAVLNAGAGVGFASLAGAGQALTVNADALAIAGAGANLGAVIVAPTTAGTAVGLAGGAGTLALDQALLDKLAGTSLTIGRTDSTVAMTGGATLALPADTVLRNGSGAVALGSVTGNTHALTVTSSGAGTLGATSGVTTLTLNGGGTTTVSGAITTTGAQNYGADTLALGGNTTLTGPAVTLGAVTGAGADLTVASASTTLNGNVTGTGAQSYGAVTLGGNVTLSGTGVSLGAVSGGVNDLIVTASGTAAFGGTVAAGTLNSNGAGTTTLAGNVTTAGNQDYNSTTLTAPVTLSTGTGGGVAFNANLNAGGNNLGIVADAVSVTGTASGLAEVALAPTADARSIGVDGAAGDLQISGALLGKFGTASKLTIGRTGGTGNITVGTAGTLTLPTDIEFRASNATLSFGNKLRGNVDLTITNGGTTSFTDTVGNGGALATITSTGGTTRFAADVDSSGAQSYGNVSLTADAQLTGSTVAIGSVVDGGGNDLRLVAAGGATLGTAVNNLATLTSTAGPTTLNGNVTTSGAQSYGAVVLGANDTLTGSTITIAGPVTGANSLTLTASTGASLAAVNGIASLTANGAGATTLNSNVTTTGAQNYGAVTLASDSTLTGTAVTLGAVTTGANDLTVAAASTTLNGNVSGTGDQSYGALTLGADVVLTGANLAIGGAVNGPGRAFTVAPSATASLAAVTTGSFTATGAGTTTLGGNVTTTGNQNYAATTLSAPVTLTGPAIALNGAFNAGANNLGIQTLGLTVPGSLTGTADLRLAGLLASNTIGLNAAGSDLSLSQAALNGFSGFGSFTLGRADGTGAISVGNDGPVALPINLSLVGATAPVTFAGAVDGNGRTLSVATGGTTAVNAALFDLASFSVAGPTTLASNVTTSGTQTYTGAVTLGATSTLTGGTLLIGNVTGGGAQDLTLVAGTSTVLGTVTGVNALAATGAGATTLNGNVSTTTTQSYGAVVLGNDSTLTGTTLTLNGPVTGANDLTLVASAGANVGTVNGLASLAATGAGATTLNGNVTTTGAQNYGAVTLGADSTLTGTAVALGTVTTGANDLTVAAASTTLNGNVSGTGDQSYGALTLGADVALTGANLAIGGAVNGPGRAFTVAPSATASLAAVTTGSFTATGAGTTTLGGNITTTGNQSYANTNLSAAVTLTAPVIAMTGAFNAGANDLGLQTLSLPLTGTLAGTGNVRIAGPLATHTIGVASAAAADLNLSQATLNAFTGFGFGSLRVGRADGTGAITVGTAGALTLPANLSILGASAPVTLGGNLNGNGRSLAVETGGNTTVNGTLSGLSSFQVDGSSTVAATVGTTGAQTWGGTVTLAGASSFTGTALDFNGATAIAAGANTLVLNTRNLSAPGTITGNGSATLGAFAAADTLGIATPTPTTATYTADEIAKFTGAGTLTLGRPADGTGAISVGALTLPRDTTVAASTAPINLEAAIAGAGHSLTVSSTGTTNLAAAPVNLSALTISGPASFAGGTISTTGAQVYGGNLGIASDATLDASNLSFGGALNIAANDLTLQYDGALTGPTSASGTGVVSLAPRTVGSTIGVAGGAGTFQVSQATLDSLTVFPTLGVGRTDGTGLVEVGALALPADFRLQSGSGEIRFLAGASGGANTLTVTTGGTTSLGGNFSNLGALTIAGATRLTAATTVGAGAASFDGPIDGAAVLTVNASGATTFGGPIGAATPLLGLVTDAAGTTSLAGNVSANGAVVLGDAVTLGAAGTTVSGSSVVFGSTVNGAAPGAQALVVNSAGNTEFAAGAGTTNALASLTTNAGGSTLLGGNVSSTGAQSYGDAVTLTGNVVLTGSTVTFASTLDGARSLAVNAAGATNLGTAVGGTTALTSLATDAGGTTTLPAGVTTTGAQSYGDAVTLTAPATVLSGTSLAFGGSVDGTAPGAQALTANAAGATSFGAPVGAGVALASLTTDAPGTTTLGGNVVTTGAQTYGDALVLAGDVVATASAVQFGASVDGARALTVNAAGITGFAGPVGGTTALSSLTTGAGGTTQLGGNVATSGAQTYGDAVLLLGDATLVAGSVSFGGSVDGTRVLTVNAAGATSFGAAVGAVTPLASLATGGGGTTTLPGSVTTLGVQAYGDNVALSATTSLVASGISFGGNLAAGAFDLRTRSDALTLAGTASGTGALDFAPGTAAGGIGLAGAPGTLQLDATLLGQLDSFAGLTIGRADGTGAISAGSFALLAPTTIVGAGAPVAFTGTVNGNGNPLAVTSGGTTTVTGTLLGLSTFALSSAAVFDGGRVETTGAQTYGGAVALNGSAVITAGSAQFGAAVDGPGAMTVQTTGGAQFVGSVGATTPLASFAASGPVQLDGGSVRTTGTQSYAGALTLGADTTLTGTDVSFGGTVDGNRALTVAASGTAAFAAPVGANTALTSLATANATQLAGNVSTSGAQTYGGALLLTGDATLAASNVTFGGSVDGAQALSSNATGTTTFAGAVGNGTALTSVTVANTARIDGGRVATSGAQSYGGAVGLGADTTITGSNLSFAGTLDGPGAIGATATGTLTLGGAVGGTTPLAAATFASTGGTTLNGNVTTTGAQAYLGPVILGADVTASASSIAFSGPIDGTRALQLNAAGATTLGAAVGATNALASLATDAAGTTTLGGNVRTSGAMTFLDATTLASDAALTGSAVTFGSTLDGARALTVNAGNTTFGAAVGATTALASLATDAAGTTRLAGNVTTTGGQTFADAVQLDGSATLTASILTLGASVDGGHALTAAVAGNTRLNGAIGAATPLASLAVAGTTALNAGSVTTTGAQAYTGAVTLERGTSLAANGLGFGAAVDGAQALTIQNAGTTSFGAAIGAITPLASLTAGGGGAVSLAGASVDTTGAQSYSGALQLAGSTRLTGSALSFGGNVAGAQDLQLQTDALATAGGVAGTGVLSITPLDPALGIGLAGGAGALQVSQAMLTSAGGFTQHVIGRTDGTGTINAGNLTLGADTTLQTRSGDIRLNGATNGGFDLVLNAGGTTRIAGPVGTTSALASLATDNQGLAGERTLFDLADGTGSAQIVTSGAQAYADPVSATVPVRFAGTTVTATQPTNRFEGAVSGSVASLSLVDSGNLSLGNLSIASGGSIQAEGTIAVGGALALGGGTLTLRSNATPTGGDFSDPELVGKTLSFGAAQLKEASATIFQTAGSSVSTAAGSLLVLRSPKNGSLLFDQASNTLLGDLSAVAGALADNDSARFGNSATTTISFLRINSNEIHVSGMPPADGNQALERAGLEADAIKLTADKLTTGSDGQIRARLPFDNLQGSQTSLPGLTLVMSPQALAIGGGFGTADPASWIQVKVGNQLGGYLTVRPKGANGDTAIILLAGADPKPFYDGAGKLTEVRVFYNGDTPRTPQESGALNAVIALVEEARHARFEEAVRTENVSSRLRSGVIAEVGSGRPATVGRESIRLPETCNLAPGQLKCE